MKDPLKLRLMDVDEKIAREDILEVTSSFIRESSSTEFHQDGLFSEYIFGEIASPDRLSRHGFINLKTRVFHPRVFKIICKLKAFYKEVMSGRSYAIFDPTEKDFIKASEEDPKADTGYSFFISHFHKIEFKSTGSITRDTKIDVLKKFKDQIFITKYLVIPAGLRDVDIEDARNTSEEINKIYSGLLNMSRALPDEEDESPIFDVIKMGIQNKTVAVYEYIHNIISGKNGFLQRKYGARNIAMGTRNVISAANMSVKSAESNHMIKRGETQLPLFQGMKAFQPTIVFQLKTMFFSQVLSDGAASVPLINPKTLDLQYVEVDAKIKDKFITSAGIGTQINTYRDKATRHLPVTVKGVDDVGYYLFLTYREGNKVFLVRSKSDLERLLEENNLKFDKKKLYPLTRIEMFYMATYYATIDKHVLITRYPITGADSIYPSKVHLITTNPSDEVILVAPSDINAGLSLPHWPQRGKDGTDSTVLHPSMLAALGGDFDGDTVNVNGVWGTDDNKEIDDHLNSLGSVLNVNGSLKAGLNTDLCQLTYFNLSRIPKPKKEAKK